MGRVLVVPDLHGRFKLARDFLTFAGVLDPDDNYARIRRPDEVVVQLGDLANCVGDSRIGDLALLGKHGWFDVRLIGNHELPYFGGPTFRGFQHITLVEQAIRNLGWKAAYAVGDTLLTHAGLGPSITADADFDDSLDASGVADLLNSEWKDAPNHRWFSAIGRSRGGVNERGGILWRDDVVDPLDLRFNQVYGHTVRSDGPHKQHHADGTWGINLDCGGHGPDVGRIVGVWLTDDGEVGETIDFSMAVAAKELV